VVTSNLFPYVLVLVLVLFVPVWGAVGRLISQRKRAR
jgi:hypothetical protein